MTDPAVMFRQWEHDQHTTVQPGFENQTSPWAGRHREIGRQLFIAGVLAERARNVSGSAVPTPSSLLNPNEDER